MARDTADDTDDAQIPTTDAGEPDFEAMLADLGIQTASRKHPSFIADETGEVTAVIDADPEVGTVTLTSAYAVGWADSRTTSLETLWREWRYDSLNFRRRRFLLPDDRVVNEGALARVVEAAEAYRRIVEESMHGPDEADSLRRAIGEVAAELPEEALD